MPRSSPLAGHFVLLGSAIPRVIGLLAGLTLILSILAAVTARNGLPGLVEWCALVPALVLHGQLWRVVTWVFFESGPLGLIIGCIGLVFFGRDLTHAWGPGRFLLTYIAAASTTGLVVSGISQVWPAVLGLKYIGPWPLVTAMIVAWAILHPHRDVFVYFVLPLRGRSLIYATLLGTLLFALMSPTGIAGSLPHFVAQGLALLYMRETYLGNLWLRMRYRFHTRGWRRRASHLRPVERMEDEPPKWLH